jgi:hypothetical protein
MKANELTDNMGKTLCSDWNRLEPAAQKYGKNALEWSNKAKSDLQCQ